MLCTYAPSGVAIILSGIFVVEKKSDYGFDPGNRNATD